MENNTDGTFQSKDYWLIIYLVAADFKIINIECKQDDRGQDYLLWTFPHEAIKVEQQYNHGEPMLIDLHKVEDAAKLFKRNLQYYRIR